jgi:hypothetical protein
MFIRYFTGFAIFAAGFMLGWATLPTRASESEFLRTTTSHYFKFLSRNGLVKYADYSDCRIVEEDDGRGRNRSQKFGICSFTNPETGKKISYSVALTPSAAIDYWDADGDY